MQLWESNAPPQAFCNANLIRNITQPYNSISCEPVGQEFLPDKGATCTIPKPVAFCKGARELAAISWITGLCSCILFILWALIIFGICRSKEKKTRKVKLMIAIPAMIAIVCEGVEVQFFTRFFTV